MKNNKKDKKNMLIRCLFWLIFAAVIMTLTVVGINLYIVIKEKSRMISLEEASDFEADCIVVLGAGIRDDGSPTWMLEDRIKIGDKLYQNHAADKIIMSGDHGRENHDEVNTMKKYAINEGIPSEDIFMDHAGFETYDSLYRARDIFGAKKVIIVTQEYHLYRALYIADRLGLEARGVTADLRFYSKKMVYWKFREYLARVKSFIKCIVQPEPKYLGDTIDLSVSGDVTNDK
ncbi:MAG: DUF218 domain-containing protein [Eubacterium sp.]|jgi:vancomycin permeability regulator SanA|nr:DUF218 domain-containing protein [Eubacterium sp.]